jgi:Trypsin
LARRSTPDGPDSPALIVLSDRWQIESTTPGVERWLSEFPDGDWDAGKLPSSVMSVAGQAHYTVDHIVVHPDWLTAPPGRGNSKHLFLAPPAEDIALVFLDTTVAGVTPAPIADADYLAGLDLTSETFTVVGYGTDAYITGSAMANHPVVLFDGIRSYRDVSVITEHDAFPDRFLKITAGVCFGDSGGPLFHEGTVGGSQLLDVQHALCGPEPGVPGRLHRRPDVPGGLPLADGARRPGGPSRARPAHRRSCPGAPRCLAPRSWRHHERLPVGVLACLHHFDEPSLRTHPFVPDARQRPGKTPVRTALGPRYLVGSKREVVAEPVSDFVGVGVAADPGHQVGVEDHAPLLLNQAKAIGEPGSINEERNMCSIGWPRPRSIASDSAASNSARPGPVPGGPPVG